MRLYDINQELYEIWDRIQQNGGEITKEDEERIDELTFTKEKKIEYVCCLIRGEEALISAISTEKKSLDDKKRSAEGSLERLKMFLSSVVGEGNKTVAGPFKIGWRSSSAVLIEDESQIPAWYIREKVTTEPDKKLIQADIEEGKVVPGAMIEKRQHIQVK